MEVARARRPLSCSNPNKLYQPCKLWMQKRCQSLAASCVYIHSYFCPDRGSCKREFCTLLHHDLENTNSDCNRKNAGREAEKEAYTTSEGAEVITIDDDDDDEIRIASLDGDEIGMASLDDDKIRMASPSPTFDDELCQELEEIGEELDRFTEETVGNLEFASDKEFQILSSTEGMKSNQNANLFNVKPAESRDSPSSFDFLRCLSRKEDSTFNPQKWLEDICKQTDWKSHDTDTVSKFRSDICQSEKEIKNNSAEVKLLLQQKSQLMKNAKFLIDQKKLLSTERDNVIKRVIIGTVDQSKVKRVLDENARLTKELSAHLQIISTNIQKINDKMSHIAKNTDSKGRGSVPIHLLKENESSLSSHEPEIKQSINTREIFDKITNSLKDPKIVTKRKQGVGETEECPQLEVKVKSSNSEQKVLANTSLPTAQNQDTSLHDTDGSKENRNCQGENGNINQDVANGGRKNTNITAPKAKEMEEQKSSVSQDRSSSAEEVKKSAIEETKTNEKKKKKSSRDKNTYWCKTCNAFYTSVYGYIEHLESMSHFENIKSGTQPRSRSHGNGRERHNDVLPQGVEFLHTTTVFFCELCSQVMYDKNEAVVHPQNSHHLMKYKEHIRANVAQEIQFMEEKMSALTEYCKRRQVKVSETASDVITEQPTEHSKSCTGLADKETSNLDSSNSNKRKHMHDQSECNKKNRMER
ncbi:zinc finger protein 318-like [Penaeus japonicus]|uniref:zinc finger protein 318-like n=1 Tax=Penaeus japonicus TaxID=27405 RepID=UPI001C713CDF|nr:zinc finger protein 318-like [Penaeus japonicus]